MRKGEDDMARRDRFDQQPEDKFIERAYALLDVFMLHKTAFTVALVVIVGAILGALAYKSHIDSFNQAALAAFEGARTADDYKTVAESYAGSAVEPLSLFYRGRKLIDAKNYDEAAAVLSSMVRSYPLHPLAPNAMLLMGMISSQQKKFEDAVQSYQTVADRYTSSFVAPLALLNMGSCYEKLNKPEEARKAYEKIAAAYPASTWKKDAEERIGRVSASSVSSGSTAEITTAEEGKGEAKKSPTAPPA